MKIYRSDHHSGAGYLECVTAHPNIGASGEVTSPIFIVPKTAGDKVEVIEVNLVLQTAITGHASNNRTFQLEHRSGTTTTDRGDALTTTDNHAVGRVTLLAHDDKFDMAKGDFLDLEITSANAGVAIGRHLIEVIYRAI
ncbi:MAG: hypothetical protein F4Y39_24755 [Gemmatimonadetes bacterium]|nr:hypothetical protein [Gemmatimonadota bacterium]MYF79160.1 hypothetical protein [Chloroflexota bacterium]